MAAVYDPSGRRRQYGYVWAKVRALILDRDAHFHNGIRTCELCGAVDGELAYQAIKGRKRAIWRKNDDGTRTRVRVCMEVDHILPFVLGGGEMDIDNCITLCRQCNWKWGDKRKDPDTEELLSSLAIGRNRAILDGEA